jgi:long-chain acyl-CoA synthetase
VPAWLAFRFRIAERLVFDKLKVRLGGRIRFMVSGGAPLSRDVALFFHAAGLVILEGYGLTETSPVICVNRLEDPRLGNVGQPVPGVEGAHCARRGILVRGPGVMKEYYQSPDATREALVDGWFHTGDIGVLDPDGFLTITDRKKDLIVTAGGKNVAPQPIESQLKADPFITEAIVIGDRRPYCVALLAPDWTRLAAWARSEGIAAAGRNGQPDPSALGREPRIRQFLMERVARVNAGLAPFETIKSIGLIERELTVADGDLTPTLKVKRRELAARFGDAHRVALREISGEPAGERGAPRWEPRQADSPKRIRLAGRGSHRLTSAHAKSTPRPLGALRPPRPIGNSWLSIDDIGFTRSGRLG